MSDIPVIDINAPLSAEEIGKKLVDAAEYHGFVYIRNLGKDIPIAAIDKQFEISKGFFASPVEDKSKCSYTQDNRGWSGMNQETLDPATQEKGDFKEAFNLGEFVKGKAQQPLSPFLATQEPVISEFFDLCHNMCLKLLTVFGAGLSISPPTWLADRHSRSLGPSGSILRYLHYPSLAALPSYRPDIDIRAGAHSDYGSLTLLFQRPGQPGLEVQRLDGTWASAPVFAPGTESDPSPPILINIGDLLNYWTNGLLRSTVHRVIVPKAENGGASEEDRYSMAFFCHPAHKTPLEGVPSRRVQEREGWEGQKEQRGQGVITAEEHLMNKLRASYKEVDFSKA